MSVNPKIRTRIAPSPTGTLHLGTVRTALYNLLFAKKHAGEFYFRLEDTDRERSQSQYTQEIIEGFKHLGIEWDIPLGFDAYLHTEFDKYGIVSQSLRNTVHTQYIDKLISEGKAYKCFASPEELQQLREEQRKQKLPEGYDNRGRLLSQEEVERYTAEGRGYVVRLNLGDPRNIDWHDIVRGPMSISTRDLGGDPVIQKKDGQVLYNFAVVVDDAEMQISHVFRGEDHLTNTAKQIAIYEALGFEVPEFGHLPLIFTTDKQKLSKRKHGDIAGIEKYVTEGYLPEAINNYLVATSYTCPSGQEVYNLGHGIANFEVSALSKSPAIYDIAKLNWYNREYMSKLSFEELLDKLKPFIEYDLSKFNEADQKLLLEGIRGNLDKLSDINENISYFFEDFEIDPKLQKFIDQGQSVLGALIDAIKVGELDFGNAELMKDKINDIGAKLELKGKQLFWPIRIAISGRSHGPDLGLVLYLLGQDRALQRLEQSITINKT